jgi:NAD(P)-dependent dehydrogenase (short-subunit alcohol dehydrogenase family)
MTTRLDGKVALVTGASRGLGRAIARRLAEAGAAVAVHYRGARDLAEATAEEIRAGGGRACAVQADATRQAETRRVVDEVVGALGALHVLVNNAGQHRRANSLEQSQSDWEDLIARNLGATYFFAQSAAAYMRRHGGGQIVNISSKMATSTAPGNAAYCAAKAGIVALTQVLAAEWARDGIRVNCVAPGVLRTEAMQEMTQGLDDTGLLERCLVARTPVGHLGEPADVAAVVAFLAAAEADFLTGSTIVVDGGWTAYGDYIGWGLARSLTGASRRTAADRRE